MDLLGRFSEWRFFVGRGLRRFVTRHKRTAVSAWRYRFRFVRRDSRGYITSRIYVDGTYTIVLSRWLYPPVFLDLACISFDILDGGIVYVRQIQGVRGRQEELQILRWDRMLLDMVVTLARESGYREVRVCASAHISWATGRNRLRYDVLPKRLGFTVGEQYHTLRLVPEERE